jgi:small subunit ribosomal protein S21
MVFDEKNALSFCLLKDVRGKFPIYFVLYFPFPYLCRPSKSLKEVLFMLIIDSKDCENIDKALKKYKKKFEKARVLLQLRERQSFTKPSVKRRGEVLKAVYKQQIASGKIDK